MLKSFVKIKDLRVYYEKDGKGEPILLLHGWGGNTQSIRPLFDILKPRFCTYSLDLPGFGRSYTPSVPWQTSDYGECIKEFLKNFGIERTGLMGHSFGGKISLWFSVNYPNMVNKLVLISSAGIKPKRKSTYYLKVFLAKTAKTFLPKGLKDKIYERIGSEDYKKAGKMRPTLIKILKEEDFKPLLSKILAPTLIIWGENDDQTPLYQGKIMEKEIKGSRLSVIKNSGHFCYLDQPQYVSSLILDFLCG